MYEKFTDRARKVMQLANQEAQRFNHEYVGTEHILLGLIKEGGGVAHGVLKELGAESWKLRVEVENSIHSGPSTAIGGKLPQTPRAKQVVQYAMEESRKLNHGYVGTEHLLLGMLREQSGDAYRVLSRHDVEYRAVKEAIEKLLDGKFHSVVEGEPVVASSQKPTEYAVIYRVRPDLNCEGVQPRLWAGELSSVELCGHNFTQYATSLSEAINGAVRYPVVDGSINHMPAQVVPVIRDANGGNAKMGEPAAWEA